MSHRTTLAALALAALVGAGCGSGEPTGAGTTAGSGSGARTSSDRDKAVRFAECLRRNGVGDFPDPNAKGEFDYGVSVSAAVWNRANDACEELKPPGTFDTTRTRKEQDAGLAFARCMREHGVEDFPDPVDGEPLINTYRIPSSNRPGGMDILNAAMQTCGDLAGAAIEGR